MAFVKLQNGERSMKIVWSMFYLYPMHDIQKNNPLHGVTLETVLNHLVAFYGWEEMDRRVRINCFHENPSVKSSLKFLRKTEWARKKVEDLYLESLDAR